MTASPRRVALLVAVVGVVGGLLAYAADGSVCLAHRTACVPADESALRTFFLPLVVVGGYALFRASETFRFE
ncbi:MULTISPECIES: hypothetical protein [Halorussus]|uniref:hypothetical protein n=1 Tax=Halorussus TaxID=1070314 RepID=UPI000E213625|nr:MULTISPECIES: hypothetical protein [Halorussus]NHN59223.1 hypothetical protein [Halorussus sp. JP-T4]